MAQLLGKKIGMTQVYDKDGAVIPITVLEAGPCYIVNLRTAEKDGYTAVQLGYSEHKKANKPMVGYFKKMNAKKNYRYLREFRLDSLEGYSLGQEIKADSFQPNELVNISGVSIGKGFQGIIKRHHANRGPMSHGSKHHRLSGSSGSNTIPGHVIKGKRRAGRMGWERVTTKNLKVVSVDPIRNLLFIKGSVPGPDNNFLMIKSTGQFAKIIERPKEAAKKKEVKAEAKAK